MNFSLKGEIEDTDPFYSLSFCQNQKSVISDVAEDGMSIRHICLDMAADQNVNSLNQFCHSDQISGVQQH